MGYHDRVSMQAKVIHHFAELEALLLNLRADLEDSLKNTDMNFPNKREDLELKLNQIDRTIDLIDQLGDEVYDIQV